MIIPYDEVHELARYQLLIALRRFIVWQGLVAQALKDLGVHLDDLAEHGAATWAAPPDEHLAAVRRHLPPPDAHEALSLTAHAAYAEAIRSRALGPPDAPPADFFYLLRRARRHAVPPTGTWHDADNQAWSYALHGRGCRLTNAQTGEPIDWNAPHVQRFDTFFFIEHLGWQLTRDQFQPELFFLRARVADRGIEPVARELIGELTTAGLLTPTREVARSTA